jgi:hypothetical protein
MHKCVTHKQTNRNTQICDFFLFFFFLPILSRELSDGLLLRSWSHRRRLSHSSPPSPLCCHIWDPPSSFVRRQVLISLVIYSFLFLKIISSFLNTQYPYPNLKHILPCEPRFPTTRSFSVHAY